MKQSLHISLANYDVNFTTYSNALNTWERGQLACRTKQGGVKAVKLTGMANCRLRRAQNGDMVFRLHDTDIVTYKPDGWVEVYTGGWESRTTLIRIRQACGLSVHMVAPSQFKCDQSLRVGINERREGRTNSWVRGTIPFVSGLRYREDTNEIEQAYLDKLPSDRRLPYETPKKKYAKEFAKMWAPIRKRLKFDITLGGVTADIAKLYSGRYYRAPQGGAGALTSLIHDVENGTLSADSPNLLLGMLGCFKSRWDYLPMKEEELRQSAISTLNALRATLLESYIDSQTDGYEQKGGNIMGNGWWVNAKDEV